MDVHALIETKIGDALRTVAGVEAVYGLADLPLTEASPVPAYFVTVTGSETLEHVGAEGWSEDKLVERQAQLDIGCIANQTRLTFMPLVRDLRTQAIRKLADLESLGLPGVYEVRLLGIQRTDFPSVEGFAGGLFLAYRVGFASRLSDFSAIAPAH